MATVTKDSYLRLIDNKPYKFDEEEVNYRDGEGDDVCRTCVHFFERMIDKFHTCEIFRPRDEGPVDPDYVCDFHTKDNETYPLLKSKGTTSASSRAD